MMRAAGVAAACLVGLGACRILAPWGLTVSRVHVDGARLTPASTLGTITAKAVGKPMSARTRDELRAHLEAHWLVRQAEISRQWPRSMAVRLAERRLVARSCGEHPVAIEATGVSWAEEGIPDVLPSLQGWTRENADAWRPALASLECLAEAPELWAESVVEAPPRDGSLEVVCPGFGIRLRLPCPPDDGLTQRISFAPTVMADMQARGARSSVVDLRWVNQIVVSEEAG